MATVCVHFYDGNFCVRIVEGKCVTSLAFLTAGHSSSDNANEVHSIFARNTQTHLTTHSGEKSISANAKGATQYLVGALFVPVVLVGSTAQAKIISSQDNLEKDALETSAKVIYHF